MIIEEAGEIVLKAGPWVMCAICRGSGRIIEGLPDDEEAGKEDAKTERVKCWACEGAGFFLPPDVEKAYQVVGAEIPPKPRTPMERIAEMSAEFIKSRLNQKSVTRRLFPSELVEKP